MTGACTCKPGFAGLFCETAVSRLFSERNIFFDEFFSSVRPVSLEPIVSEIAIARTMARAIRFTEVAIALAATRDRRAKRRVPRTRSVTCALTIANARTERRAISSTARARVRPDIRATFATRLVRRERTVSIASRRAPRACKDGATA